MARIHPSLKDLEDCGEPLSSAEVEVARALARLDDGWTVYVRPRLGLALPHFVAVNDDHGVCAIEVAGWLRGTHRQAADGAIERREIGGIWQRVPHPRFESDRHRTTIYDQYFALPGDPSEPGDAVRATVVMPRFSNRHARELLGHPEVDAAHAAIDVWGGDGLHGQIEAIVGGVSTASPPSESMRRLRSHLITVGAAADPPPAVPLTAAIGIIEQNPTGASMRRVRGPAGSGKSFGLTARAAQLAAEGKRVLVLSFNVTLANHLAALVAARCRERDADPTLVACANFHTFCERVVQDAAQLGIDTAAPHGARWPEAIVARATQAFEGGFRRYYDAVLVDEGQDYTRAWWDLLRRHAVVESGELLLVADPTQNLYGRAGWLDDGEAAGFTEEWIELTDCYRMPIDLVPRTNEFALEQLDDEPRAAVVPADRHEIAGACSGSMRHWTNVDGLAEVGPEIGREVVRLLHEHPELSPRDVVFLCEYHRDGEAAAAEIEAAGYPVHHLFSRDPDDPRRKRRYRFWPDADAVKGCTVHSFKGWSAHALVMGIGLEARSRHAAYISMTRVASGRPGDPPYLSVINADKQLADLQSTFTSGIQPDEESGVDEEIVAAVA